MDAGGHVRHHVLRQRAVPLPAVGPALGVLAVDEEALPALIAVAAALDVVHQHPVPRAEVQHALAHLDHLAAGLVAADHVVVARAAGLVGVLVVDVLEVAAAEAAGLHLQ